MFREAFGQTVQTPAVTPESAFEKYQKNVLPVGTYIHGRVQALIAMRDKGGVVPEDVNLRNWMFMADDTGNAVASQAELQNGGTRITIPPKDRASKVDMSTTRAVQMVVLNFLLDIQKHLTAAIADQWAALVQSWAAWAQKFENMSAAHLFDAFMICVLTNAQAKRIWWDETTVSTRLSSAALTRKPCFTCQSPYDHAMQELQLRLLPCPLVRADRKVARCNKFNAGLECSGTCGRSHTCVNCAGDHRAKDVAECWASDKVDAATKALAEKS